MKTTGKLEHGQQQNSNSVFDSTLQEFMKLWKSGQEAALNVNCKNGRAWLNLSTYLGYFGNDSWPLEDIPKRSKT